MSFPDDDGIVVPSRKIAWESTSTFSTPRPLGEWSSCGAVCASRRRRGGDTRRSSPISALLDIHVRAHRLGHICVSPIDVVLDELKALVVQPDVLCVSSERMAMVRQRVFGAPDLTIEVLSFGTAFRDRTEKLAWYRDYGVRECWLVDPVRVNVEVFPFEARADVRTFEGH